MLGRGVAGAASGQQGEAGNGVDGVALLEHEVRELIRRRGIDPLRDAGSLRALVHDVVADYDERSLRGHVPPLTDPAAASKAAISDSAARRW